MIIRIFFARGLALPGTRESMQRKDDTVRRQVVKDGYLDYRLLAKGKSLFPRYPSSTSWEAAKSTGIISEFDYETIEVCEGAYAMQEIILNSTLLRFLEEAINRTKQSA